MDAIKKVLSPGNRKDDEIMYGDGSSPSATGLKDQGSGAYNAGVPKGDDAPTLHTLPDSEKKEHGILRQILNPGGEKYDPAMYGENATTDASAVPKTYESTDAKHPILDQITNPGGDKYDPVRYGSDDGTTTTPGTGSAPTDTTYATTGATSQDTTTAHPSTQSHLGRDAAAGGLVGAGAATMTNPSRSSNTQSTMHPSSTSSTAAAAAAAAAALQSTSTSYPQTSTSSAATTGGPTGHHHGISDNELTHHVHNGVTEMPVRRSAQNDYNTASASTLRGAGNSTDSTPVTHISTARPAHTEGGVYNTIVGKGSDNTTSSSAAPYSTASHGTTSNMPSQSTSHAGPAADLAGGTLAATAAREAALRHDTPEAGFGTATIHDTHPSTSREAGGAAAAAGSTTTPHRSSLLNMIDPRVNTRDTAAAGAAGGASYGFEKHREKETAAAASPSTTETSSPVVHKSSLLNKLDPRVKTEPSSVERSTEPTEQKEHHYGRDAAVAGGVGSAGVGAYTAGKHHDVTSAQQSSASSQPVTRDTTVGSSTSASQSQKPDILTKLGLKSDPSDKAASTEAETSNRHTGRDAALVGGTGAAVGAYEAEKHHKHHDTTSPAATTDTEEDTKKRGLLEKLGLKKDKSDVSPAHESESHRGRDAALVGAGGAATGAGLYEADKHHHSSETASTTTAAPVTTSSTPATTTSDAGTQRKPSMMEKLGLKKDKSDTMPETESKSHHGRDAALVGAGGTAAGIGAYEAEKHHHHHESAAPTTAQTSSSTTAPAATSSSNIQSEQKPSLMEKLGLKKDKSGISEPERESHRGRDAALVGGTGAAVGAGAYEADKHHHRDAVPTTSTSTASQPATSSTAATDSVHKPTIMEKLGLKKDRSEDPEHDSHRGRDAALVGTGDAATAAGIYEADKHHRKAEQEPVQHEKHHHEKSHHEKTHHDKENKPGLLTKLGLKKDKSEEPVEQESHIGRNTALVGGAGAAGAGAYEADKHHHRDVQPAAASTTSATQGPPIATTTNHRSSFDNQPNTQESHTARNAALAGGAGALGVGAYEAEKHHHQTSTQPTGTTTSSYTSPTTTTTTTTTTSTMSSRQPTTQHESHTGRNAALAGGAGALGVGAYEAEKHHSEREATQPGTIGSSTVQSGNTSSTTHPGSTTSAYQQPSHESYGGRDAAVVGGAGALGVGAYEADKHHREHETGRTAAASSQPATATSTQPTHDSHKGRDAALIGGAGAGAYEAEKHHKEKEAAKSATHHESKHEEKSDKPGLLTRLGLRKDKSGKEVEEEEEQQAHHHGRDAAVVGGTGAAIGAGAYEAEKHHHAAAQPTAAAAATQPQVGSDGLQYTGPASDTIGPHKSNILNVLDPRVKPEPTLMKQRAEAGYPDEPKAYSGPASSTIGPHQSNVANVLDPRVLPQPDLMHDPPTGTILPEGQTVHGAAATEREQHHHHTSEHLAEGAAVGAGTAGAAHEAHEHNQHHHDGEGAHTEVRHGIAVSHDEHGHSKLHKEKKEGFISKLLHGGSKDREGSTSSSTTGKDAALVGGATGVAAEGAHHEHRHDHHHAAHHGEAQTRSDSIAKDPVTGLPVNTALGDGAGGTDGNTAMGGFHEGENRGSKPVDWETMGKQNTPY